MFWSAKRGQLFTSMVTMRPIKQLSKAGRRETRGNPMLVLAESKVVNVPLFAAYKVSGYPTLGKFAKSMGYTTGRISQLLRCGEEEMSWRLTRQVLNVLANHCFNPSESHASSAAVREKNGGLELSCSQTTKPLTE